MDITLERILSLLPKNETGKYIRGAKKDFAESLNLAHNIIPEWVKGKNKSYTNYLYEIAAKYHVSVEWLKGESDVKEPFDLQLFSSDKEKLMASIDTMSKEELLDFIAKATEVLREK